MNICTFDDGAGTRTIRVAGKLFLFDFSQRFGPLVVGQHGEERSQPGNRHLFWRAISWWVEQGKEIAEDGTCKWIEPPSELEGMLKVGNAYFPPETVERLGYEGLAVPFVPARRRSYLDLESTHAAIVAEVGRKR